MDLFENYDQQPKILSDILNQYDLENMTYKNCKEMLQKVNEIGYTFEYGLDAEPFNLHNIKTKEIETLNKKLIERLNETHRAIDSALETMDEMGLNLKETDFYQEIAAELAPNETLLREIEASNKDKEEKELEDAMDKVTIDMINNLAHGEDQELNKTYVISKYIEDDVIVIVKTEEWEEVLQVMTNGDKVEFESLV